MIKLDDDLLAELGLSAMPPEEKKKMLAHIYETLEMRVGMKLAEQMSDAQLSEFEQFIDRNDEAGALRWLETNFPNYKDVVAQEFERLKGEIKQVAPQIVAASHQQATQPSVDHGATMQQHPQSMPSQQQAGYPSQPTQPYGSQQTGYGSPSQPIQQPYHPPQQPGGSSVPPQSPFGHQPQ